MKPHLKVHVLLNQHAPTEPQHYTRDQQLVESTSMALSLIICKSFIMDYDRIRDSLFNKSSV